MANAPVLKTGVRKDLGVRIPRPPSQSGIAAAWQPAAAYRIRCDNPKVSRTRARANLAIMSSKPCGQSRP